MFEKEDSLGNLHYNELKEKYPEYFAEEVAKETVPVAPKPTTEELLTEIVAILKEKKN
jgi:hypothetical protein